MIYFMWGLAGFLIWYLIGCAVMVHIDDKNQTLFKWAKQAPLEILFVAFIMAWPYVWFKWSRYLR